MGVVARAKPSLRGRSLVGAGRQQRPAGSIFVWRILFTDSRGRWLCEQLLSIRADTTRGGPAARTIGALATGASILSSAADDQARRRLGELSRDVHQYVAMMTAREEAIAAVLTRQQARLASALAQRQLFSHWSARTSVAQAALVADALHRTAARLQLLAETSRARIDERRLVFALALE